MERRGAPHVDAVIRCVATAALLLAFGPVVGAQEKPESVRLQLKWRHQFQFAGYYAALERGYYRDAGFDVTLLPGKPGTDPSEAVLTGQAEFGVASSELALRFAMGAPVVVLGVVFQHSALTLFARQDAGIATLHDLVGKRVALAPWESEIYAYFGREGVPAGKLKIVEHEFNVHALIEGRVDALVGYDTDEPWYLKEEPERYLRFSPRTAGIDFYGDALFTSRSLAASRPSRAQAFRLATWRGWQYALSHPDEMAEAIHARWAPDLPVEKLRFEAAQVRQLIRPDLVEIGYHYPGRWRHILEVYDELDVIPPVEGLAVEGLMFQPQRSADHRGLIWLAMGSLSVIAAVAWVAWRFYLQGRELTRRLEENRLLQKKLEEMALRDPLTGLYNRRILWATLERELARAAREESRLALAILDLDHFKQVNDSHGHTAGDEVLRRFGEMLAGGCRGGDFVCRYGGEEFLVFMPDASADALAVRIERWATDLAALRFRGKHDFGVHFSAGLAEYPTHALDGETLLRVADLALYEAKRTGRNRICRADSTKAPGRSRV